MKAIVRLLAGLAFLGVGGARLGATLPVETTVIKAARFEIMRGDKVSGAITLAVGEKLALLDTSGNYALVRYRNLNGRVLLEHTDVPPASPAVGNEPAVAAELPAPVVAPATAAPRAPASRIERSLAGKLVRLEGGGLQAFSGSRLAGVKFYALYFSASWCGPCREFTPGLVDAYGKIRELYPEFEVVLVNMDHSAGDMVNYMRSDKMNWPAVKWDAVPSASDLTRYCGDGIPCLVLVDENGTVLSDTNRSGSYVGPNAVLDDTWKILRDFRRKNPRAKS